MSKIDAKLTLWINGNSITSTSLERDPENNDVVECKELGYMIHYVTEHQNVCRPLLALAHAIEIKADLSTDTLSTDGISEAESAFIDAAQDLIDAWAESDAKLFGKGTKKAPPEGEA